MLTYPSHPIGLVFIGLLMAQVLATAQVYLSDLDLYATVSTVDAAGYLAVPNQKVMGTLQNLTPAFFGGLFFTLTVGAGLTLVALAAAWLWVRVCARNEYILVFFLCLWVLVLFLVNIDGVNPMASLYFLLIPPALFRLTAGWESRRKSPSGRMRLLVHLAPVPLLALMWFTQFDRDLFLDLRDNLLLSNTWGKKFSNFYYTYTLYPAEVFKSLDQKNIKTYAFEKIQDRAVVLRLENKLAAAGWLLLPEDDRTDLKIVQDQGSLVLKNDKRVISKIPQNEFLKNPEDWLHRYSQQIDRKASFRLSTFLSLLLGFPILIYLLMHAALYYLFSVFIGNKTAALTSSVTCLLIGIVVLIYFQSNRGVNIDVPDISQALESNNWQTRVAALKMIDRKKLEVSRYPAYQNLLQSRIPQERYWLAKTLAYGRRAGTYTDLLTFLNDPNINVQTKALYALGQRRNPRAIKPIIEKIETSNSWYTQMYAYNALRSLGWKQIKSP